MTQRTDAPAAGHEDTGFSALFIRRPVATSLLTLGIVLAGVVAFKLLPVSPLPQVDFPTISVQASMPGASPETMAATVATPLERALGRIAGVTEMTSSSSLNSTRVTLQFDLNRDIDGAARDVQAAINAARSLLPTGLPSNPTYKKVNPADAPIMILALTSKTMTRGQMYDAASTILAQKISQLKGIGQVTVGGSSLPAVRVELNPSALNRYGISLETVRTVIASTNANRPKGIVEDGDRNWQIYANDQAKKAAEYIPLIIGYRNGNAVRISDVAEVVDSVEDLRNAGSANGQPSVLVVLYKQPGANIIDTVDSVKELLPVLNASLPTAIDLSVALDRTPTIRASLREVERTLVISTALVIMVVFLFLRNVRATLIPAVAVPVSLIGTFSVMYLCGYSLDNLSLMALTIATGFVVDDAIVVLENVSRHIENGVPPMQAALRGTREVAFTVLSMSLSLIAVFIPILAMGGILGRLFREFAVTLSVAILVSLVVSLTTTPMMCSRLLKGAREDRHVPRRSGFVSRASERAFAAMRDGYERSLAWALAHGPFTMLILAATVCLNVYLYVFIPKGFFPQQDTGRMIGSIQADQSTSFQAMQQKLADFIEMVRSDPAVENVVGFIGGGQRNSGFMFITLKPLAVRKISADQVVARLRPRLASEPGASLFLVPVQDIRVGGRQSNAQYQFTLQADDLAQLRTWEPRIRQALSQLPELTDVNTDAQDKGLQTTLIIDRDTASRLGVSPSLIDATLNDAFGQRQVSTIYNPLNQYHVIMEAAPRYWQSPDGLKDVYVMAGGAQVPLSAFSSYTFTNTPLSVNHQGQFVASTISFNLPQDVSLSDATRAIYESLDRLGVPTSVHGNFQGTARVFQDSLRSQPWLLLAALVTMYIVLGVLYE
ncbi:MAG TPA: efflux RND transporter permease subunit, partial [Burkholderiales bacterium]